MPERLLKPRKKIKIHPNSQIFIEPRLSEIEKYQISMRMDKGIKLRFGSKCASS